MRLLLEHHEVGLAQHRGVDVVHGRGQQLAPGQRVRLLAQQAVGHQHLAEDRGGLGERQRGVLGEQRVVLREHAVDRVPQLVRERRHVAHPAGVVDQHPGREARQDRGAESAAALALADLAVEVVLGEHPLRHLREARMEVVEGLQHRAHRVGVLDGCGPRWRAARRGRSAAAGPRRSQPALSRK